ncbi:MAG: DUF4303 domain-containing protein [Gemmatimonadota bacterium]|nr:MAG: DUF4303 domain-containing protein [Gemmatimonadota bacterium]
MNKPIDFDLLRQQIVEGLRKELSAVRDADPAESFYAYALSTDSEVEAVFWAANSEESLSRQLSGYSREPTPDDIDDERWIPEQWSYGGTLDEPTDTIADWSDGLTDGNICPNDPTAPYWTIREKILDTFVEALAELDAAGFFGDAALREETTLLVSYTEGNWDQTLAWAKRLNPPGVCERLPLFDETPMKPREEAEFQPDQDLLSDVERDFLCLASRGKHAKLASIHEEVGIRELVLNEALVLAARTGKADVCSYLLQVGANPSHQGYGHRTPREIAEQEGRKRLLPLLPSGGRPDEVSPELRYALDKEIHHLLTVVIPQQRAPE